LKAQNQLFRRLALCCKTNFNRFLYLIELDDEDKRRYDRLMRKKQEKSAQSYREAVMVRLAIGACVCRWSCAV
jgi:hypothetical protein